MVLLQPKLNLRVSQKQILTPGLVQMVSVLALNKLELKDMITQEITENPVLEELESPIPLLDDIAQKEEDRERKEKSEETSLLGEKSDPFDQIDFGSYFREYLDPGFRSPGDFELSEKPSFENFLSNPSTLTDHLMWQLGAMTLTPEVRAAAELVIGNLNEDGYLTASEEELLGLKPAVKERPKEIEQEPGEILGAAILADAVHEGILFSADSQPSPAHEFLDGELADAHQGFSSTQARKTEVHFAPQGTTTEVWSALKDANDRPHPTTQASSSSAYSPQLAFNRETLLEGLEVVRQMDPVGVAARDLRECLLMQLRYMHRVQSKGKVRSVSGGVEHNQEHPTNDPQEAAIADAIAIVDSQLRNIQNKQYREIARVISRPLEAVVSAIDLIKTLDPKPGARYNKAEPKLIEPDVAFVKQGDEWVVMMNEDDIPVLRLNPGYKRLMHRDAAEKDVRNYVKERYKSAIQLMKNIEQRKHTILRTCYAIIGRQRDFLEQGIEHLKPMMIKDVAEEIGVHPSTVSRAVANKYVHTPQGVFELRYFFSESVQGPEGSNTSLMLLKRKVKKLIEEEDPKKPFTDDQLAKILQSQGIQVTRRTVAKYREDMRIASTHQRRVKD